MIMDAEHKQVVTTYPVAIRSGQTRIHIPHGESQGIEGELTCPDCPTTFIVVGDFSTDILLAQLAHQHKNGRSHPDYIPAKPEWTSVVDCKCGK